MLTQVRLDSKDFPGCSDCSSLEEGLRGRPKEMGSLWGHTPTSDAVAGNRDLTQVLHSPRVGGSNSAFHPMSRRSLSQKRMQEPSPYLLLKYFKTQRNHEGDDSPRDSTNRSEHGGDNSKPHKREYHFSRFADAASQHASGVCCWFSDMKGMKRNWRQAAFYVSALLVVTFMVVKILKLGLYSIHDQSSDVAKVIPFLSLLFLTEVLAQLN